MPGPSCERLLNVEGLYCGFTHPSDFGEKALKTIREHAIRQVNAVSPSPSK